VKIESTPDLGDHPLARCTLFVSLRSPFARRVRVAFLELVRVARAGLERRVAAGLEPATAPALLDRTLARVEAGSSAGWRHRVENIRFKPRPDCCRRHGRTWATR